LCEESADLQPSPQSGHAAYRRIDTGPHADIMSDMRTFTVRDLDHSPGEVLAASRADGKSRVRERSGQSYIIVPEAPPKSRISALPDFSARRAALFPKRLPQDFARKLDNALAGE